MPVSYLICSNNLVFTQLQQQSHHLLHQQHFSLDIHGLIFGYIMFVFPVKTKPICSEITTKLTLKDFLITITDPLTNLTLCQTDKENGKQTDKQTDRKT